MTMEEFDTPYVSVTIRTLVDASDPDDIKKANAIQDGFIIKSESAIPYTHPEYDNAGREATFKQLLALSRGLLDSERMFGKKEDVDPVCHLLGTALGWGGLPESEA